MLSNETMDMVTVYLVYVVCVCGGKEKTVYSMQCPRRVSFNLPNSNMVTKSGGDESSESSEQRQQY